MTSHRPPRVMLAAALLVLASLSQLAAAILPALAADAPDCPIDLFGMQLGGPDPSCYFPVGPAVAMALAWLALGLALVRGPSGFRLLAGVAAGGAAVLLFPPVLAETATFHGGAITVSLLSAVPFLAILPSGATARTLVRIAWVAVILVVGVLTLLDIVVSGMFTTNLQLSSVVVAASILAAGLAAPRLDTPGAGTGGPA